MVRISKMLSLFFPTSIGALAVVFTVLPCYSAHAQTASGASRSPAVQAAIGKDVIITGHDGVRLKGRLLSLTDREVALNTDRGRRVLTLDAVRDIKRDSHATRNGAGIGLASGLLGGVIGCTVLGCGDNHEDLTASYAVFFGEVGAGLGALIGHIAKTSSAQARVLYQSPTGTTVAILPALTRGGAKVVGTLVW